MIALKKLNSRTQQNQSSELYESLLAARMADERILWWGYPDTGLIRKQQRAVFRIVFCLGLSAISFCLSFSIIARKFPGTGPWVILAFLLLLIVLAFVGVSGILQHYKRAARTIYGVTDKHVLTVTLDRKGEADVKRYIPALRSRLKCGTLSHGLGDLIYTRWRMKDGENVVRAESWAMILIPNVRQVEQLIRRTFLT